MTKQNSKSTTGYAEPGSNLFARTKAKIQSALPLFRKNYTYISQEVSFNGDLSALENVVLDGRMCGNIRATKHVALGSTARFEGTIECESATISGNVTGSICTSKTITVCVPATINGDLISASVQIESGVLLNGKIISKPVDSHTETAAEETQEQQWEEQQVLLHLPNP